MSNGNGDPQVLDSALVIRISGFIYLIPGDDLTQYHNPSLEALPTQTIDDFFSKHKVDAACVKTVTALNGDHIRPKP
jgi:hypothetical protein